MDELLSTQEAAARLRVSVETLRRWVKTGVIKPHRRGVGRAPHFFLKSTVEEMLKPKVGA